MLHCITFQSHIICVCTYWTNIWYYYWNNTDPVAFHFIVKASNWLLILKVRYHKSQKSNFRSEQLYQLHIP